MAITYLNDSSPLSDRKNWGTSLEPPVDLQMDLESFSKKAASISWGEVF
jgi:hypothetical protein